MPVARCRGPARRSAADSLALRSPHQLVRRMALGQRHHAAPRPACTAQRVNDLRRFLCEAHASADRHRHAAPNDARHVSFLLAVAAFVALPWIPTRSKHPALGLACRRSALYLRRRHRRARRLLPLSAVAARRVAHRRLALALCLGRTCGATPHRASRYALLALVPVARPGRAPGQHQRPSRPTTTTASDVPQRASRSTPR